MISDIGMLLHNICSGCILLVYSQRISESYVCAEISEVLKYGWQNTSALKRYDLVVFNGELAKRMLSDATKEKSHEVMS